MHSLQLALCAAGGGGGGGGGCGGIYTITNSLLALGWLPFVLAHSSWQ